MFYLFYLLLLITFNLYGTEKTFLKNLQARSCLLSNQDLFPDAFTEYQQEIQLSDSKQSTLFAQDDTALLGLRSKKDGGSKIFDDYLETEFDYLFDQLRKSIRDRTNNASIILARRNFAHLLKQRMYRVEKDTTDRRMKASRSIHSIAAHKEQTPLLWIKAQHTVSKAWVNRRLSSHIKQT